MSAYGWFFLILSLAVNLIAIPVAWKASPPVDLRGILARAALSLHARFVPEYGSHAAIPGPVVAGELVTALPAAQVAAHADAMFAASEEFLPPSPFDWMAAQPHDGPVFRTLASYMQAGRAVEIPETPDRPPWMITTNALDAVPATDEGTLAMYHGRHSRREPAFGVDRCEADVLAAEAGAQMAAGYLP